MISKHSLTIQQTFNLKLPEIKPPVQQSIQLLLILLRV